MRRLNLLISQRQRNTVLQLYFLSISRLLGFPKTYDFFSLVCVTIVHLLLALFVGLWFWLFRLLQDIWGSPQFYRWPLLFLDSLDFPECLFVAIIEFFLLLFVRLWFWLFSLLREIWGIPRAVVFVGRNPDTSPQCYSQHHQGISILGNIYCPQSFSGGGLYSK